MDKIPVGQSEGDSRVVVTVIKPRTRHGQTHECFGFCKTLQSGGAGRQKVGEGSGCGDDSFTRLITNHATSKSFK